MFAVENDNLDDEADVLGMSSTWTTFLDPQYNLLKLLMPTATQSRLSCRVELIADKSHKQISNEAIKVRLQKCSSTFRAEDMPIDDRGIAL